MAGHRGPRLRRDCLRLLQTFAVLQATRVLHVSGICVFDAAGVALQRVRAEIQR